MPAGLAGWLAGGAGSVAGLHREVGPVAVDSPSVAGGRHAEGRLRRQAAIAVLAAGERAFRRTAGRYSLCADDAEDAYQRAVEILLTRAPGRPPEQLAAWMQVVTRREALSVRRSRERLLDTTGAEGDPVERLVCERPGPAEHAEHRERVSTAARALAALKPDERVAIALQAHGYSYAEIGDLCGWTYTKVNRCIAEGRARLRKASCW